MHTQFITRCSVCGKDIARSLKRAVHTPYCSNECRNSRQKTSEVEQRACLHCGKMFLVHKNRIEKAIFCSRKCGYLSRRVPATIDRFLAYVDMTGPCWVWVGGITGAGYGNYRQSSAHRFAYLHLVGPIPDGLLVLHKCDNRSCVNPDHLFLGTYKDNTLDMMSKGRGRWDRAQAAASVVA